MKPIYFSSGYPTAKKEYVCDGCGEIPIEKGAIYMYSRMRDSNGAYHVARYCIRCACAIQASMEHTGENNKIIQKGDLKFCRLAAPFRKAWNRMIQRFIEDGDDDKAKQDFMYEIGINGLNVGARTMADVEKSKEQRAKRIYRKDARELKKEHAANVAFKSELMVRLHKIKTEMLRLKVVYIEGKVSYVEQHADVVKLLVGLEEWINGTR